MLKVYLRQTSDSDGIECFTISIEIRANTNSMQTLVIDSEYLSDDDTVNMAMAEMFIEKVKRIAQLNGFQALIDIDPEDYMTT